MQSILLVLPMSRRTGNQMKWPTQRAPQRRGGFRYVDYYYIII